MATQNDKIFTVDLTFTTYGQINGKDFINFCGQLGKHELYKYTVSSFLPKMAFLTDHTGSIECTYLINSSNKVRTCHLKFENRLEN